MTRRAAAALIVAVLGLSSLGMPALADDRRDHEHHRAPEQRAHPEQRPAIRQQQSYPGPRPSIGQRDHRERFDHRPPIPQRERIDDRSAVRPPHIENRSANQSPPRADHRPPFQARERRETRPAIPPAPRFNLPTAVQPHDRFDHRPASAPTNASRDRNRIAPGSAIERHERQWHERRFADRDPHRWRGGHWQHGYRGGHMGWWWVIGPAWYLYPAPIYPYPDPDAHILIIDSPETVIPAADVCREFNGDAIVDDTGEPFYGTACLQPDGLWHIVIG